MRLARFVFAALFVFAAGCRYNPATGRSQLLLMSSEDAIALGTESKPALILEYGGEVESAQLRSYVSLVGHSLASLTEADYPQLPWEFTVLDSDVINAFALPGGKVFASRGLLARLDSEAQMAGVLGHEVGHVTAQSST
jgi:predicted Zn-dependent protease